MEPLHLTDENKAELRALVQLMGLKDRFEAPKIDGVELTFDPGSLSTELSAITRRAFVPGLVVQIHNSSPLIKALMANSQKPNGGFTWDRDAQFTWDHYHPDILSPKMKAQRRFDKLDAARRKNIMRGK